MLIIGIAGGSGSGKTTVVKRIKNSLPKGFVNILPQDAYYKDNGHLTPEERAKINFDHPDAIEFELLIAQIKDLGANDLILSVSTNSKNYISNPGISEVVSITVTDGKISASIPKVTLSDDASNTITFEGKLLEY